MKGHSCRHRLALCLMVLGVLAASAEVAVNRVTVDVVLHANGSARFTEVWDVDIDQTKHTEFYQTRPTRSIATVEDFTVSDRGREFANVGEWDSEASNKEGRCGIITLNGGYQMCWGIGQPGHHSYKISYTITNFIRPYSADRVVFNSVLFQGEGLRPHSVSATISRADSVLTEDDVIVFEPSEDNTEASFEHGKFMLSTEHPMAEDDYLSVHIEFDKNAFGEMKNLGSSAEMSPEELSSPMMSDTNVGKYEESWLDKFWDFYDEWPVLTLLGILGGMIGLFYVVRKIAIALA